jgi:hypothetical protein
MDALKMGLDGIERVVKKCVETIQPFPLSHYDFIIAGPK